MTPIGTNEAQSALGHLDATLGASSPPRENPPAITQKSNPLPPAHVARDGRK